MTPILAHETEDNDSTMHDWKNGVKVCDLAIIHWCCCTKRKGVQSGIYEACRIGAAGGWSGNGYNGDNRDPKEIPTPRVIQPSSTK